MTTLLRESPTCASSWTPLRVLDFPQDRLVIDPSIARGLDYYTGTVYETLLGDLPAIGSVCSGGRYDDLAGLYTKQHLPGVGASLGLDRLMAAMEELGLLQDAATSADVFIVQFSAEALPSYITLARRLRQAGLRIELYPEAKGMGRQLKYADRKGFPIALIGGPDELEKGVWQVKDMRDGSSDDVADGDLVSLLAGKAIDPADYIHSKEECFEHRTLRLELHRRSQRSWPRH